MDPQAELSWQLPVPGKEQKVSRVLPSDLLNSENQAKFRLVKATLHIPFSFLFVFYRHMCGENGASFFFFFFFPLSHNFSDKSDVWRWKDHAERAGLFYRGCRSGGQL